MSEDGSAEARFPCCPVCEEPITGSHVEQDTREFTGGERHVETRIATGSLRYVSQPCGHETRIVLAEADGPATT